MHNYTGVYYFLCLLIFAMIFVTWAWPYAEYVVLKNRINHFHIVICEHKPFYLFFMIYWRTNNNGVYYFLCLSLYLWLFL